MTKEEFIEKEKNVKERRKKRTNLFLRYVNPQNYIDIYSTIEKVYFLYVQKIEGDNIKIYNLKAKNVVFNVIIYDLKTKKFDKVTFEDESLDIYSYIAFEKYSIYANNGTIYVSALRKTRFLYEMQIDILKFEENDLKQKPIKITSEAPFGFYHDIEIVKDKNSFNIVEYKIPYNEIRYI